MLCSIAPAFTLLQLPALPHLGSPSSSKCMCNIFCLRLAVVFYCTVLREKLHVACCSSSALLVCYASPVLVDCMHAGTALCIMHSMDCILTLTST